MRLIDADVAIEELTDRSHQAAKRVGTDSPFWEGLVIARRIVNNLPTVQPEPQEGHWIWVAGELMCSECRTIYSDLYPDYDNSVACPHCGAKMTISTK